MHILPSRAFLAVRALVALSSAIASDAMAVLDTPKELIIYCFFLTIHRSSISDLHQ
jgi:hypothetical protein